MGGAEYHAIVDRYRVPIVITGFEPLDILQGVQMCVEQLEAGIARLENQYARSVRSEGNQHARNVVEQVFTSRQFVWRGMGAINKSGLQLQDTYQRFDAELKFSDVHIDSGEQPDSECISGDILQGLKRPNECPAFGADCTPEHPLGATMVSGEGACQAYYRYR